MRHSMSTLPPACAAAARMASSMALRSARARSREVERHSPDSQQVPGTTFVAPSHSMTPTLDVVCAEMRPKGIWQTACAAMASAETPRSGSTPACADFPRKVAVNVQWHGAWLMMVPGSPSASNT